MSETPTPAPALTDEQIDAFDSAFMWLIRESGMETALDDWPIWLAAVIARAKREERERIGDELAAWLDAENAPPIWHEAVDIADPTWCDRHPEEADHA